MSIKKNNTTRTIVIALASTAFGSAHAACDISVDAAYTSKVSGMVNVAYTPSIGEDYRVTADIRVISGTPTGNIKVRFLMAGRTKDVWLYNTSVGVHQVSANMGALPLDGSIPIKVTVDPLNTTGDTTWVNNIKNASFSPIPDAAVKTYFGKQRLEMTQTANLAWYAGGSLSRMLLMMGQPSTDSWQSVVSSNCTVLDAWGTHNVPAVIGNEGFQGVFAWDKSNPGLAGAYMVQKTKVDVSNVKINKGLITAGWAQIDALQGINVFKYYTKPEAVIESNSPEIGAFVTGALGANYRNTMTPYTAARKLFQATVKRMEYVAPSPSNTAVETYINKKGDCGAYSILFVAACRRVGIPARTACGAWIGVDAGHCWAECYLPGAGWVLSDGSASEAWDQSGDYAYCFGNIFDLNARMACMRGNTFTAGGVTTSWLQGPGIWFWGSSTINYYSRSTKVVKL